MSDQTYRTAFYPLNETGIELTFAEVEYKILEQEGHVIKAKFVGIHHKIENLNHIQYEIPSLFTIDTSKKVLLTENGNPFAKTTIFRERS